jgi:hypothetical protein
MPKDTSEDLDLVMNSAAVMIGGTRVTFEKVEGSEIPSSSMLRTRKYSKQSFPSTCSGVDRMGLDPNQCSATTRKQQQPVIGGTVRGSHPGGCDFSLTRINRH